MKGFFDLKDADRSMADMVHAANAAKTQQAFYELANSMEAIALTVKRIDNALEWAFKGDNVFD